MNAHHTDDAFDTLRRLAEEITGKRFNPADSCDQDAIKALAAQILSTPQVGQQYAAALGQRLGQDLDPAAVRAAFRNVNWLTVPAKHIPDDPLEDDFPDESADLAGHSAGAAAGSN